MNDTFEGETGNDIDAREPETANEMEDAGKEGRKSISAVFRSVGEWEWGNKEVPEAKPLLNTESGDPWLPRGKVGMVAAPGGTGKTTALLQLAIAVATGRDWFGKFEVEESGPVVCALAETSRRDYHRMYANAVETLELSDNEIQKLKNNLYALPLDGRPVGLMQDPMPKLRSLRQMKMDDRIPKREDGAPDMEKLSRTKRCEEWRELLEDKPSDGRGWKLVILDPASRFIGPEVEKDNAAATQFIQILEDWKNNEDIKGDNDIGPTILISHHVSKSHNDTPIEMLYKQGAARGSSALTDGVRWQLNMNDGMVGEPNGDLSRYVVMSAPKQNDSEGQDGITWLQNKANSRFLKKLDNPPLGDLMGPSDIAEWKKENNEQKSNQSNSGARKP